MCHKCRMTCHHYTVYGSRVQSQQSPQIWYPSMPFRIANRPIDSAATHRWVSQTHPLVGIEGYAPGSVAWDHHSLTKNSAFRSVLPHQFLKPVHGNITLWHIRPHQTSPNDFGDGISHEKNAVGRCFDQSKSAWFLNRIGKIATLEWATIHPV